METTLANASDIDFSLIALFMRATLTVKIVMIMLIVASFWSWAIIIQKHLTFRRARVQARAFDAAFWSGEPLDELYMRIGADPSSGPERVFAAGMAEWQRSHRPDGALIPGTVFMYQGEELGLPDAPIPADRVVDPASERGSLLEGRDPCRVPLPWTKGANQAGFSAADDSWLPIPQSYHDRAVSVQDPDPDSPLNYTRRVNAWRRANPQLAEAPITFYQGVDEPLLAFKRGSGSDQVTALFNTTGEDVKFRLHNYDLIEDISGQRLLGPGEYVDVTIPAYGMLVKAANDAKPFPLPAGAQSHWLKADGKPLMAKPGGGPAHHWGDMARRLLGEISDLGDLGKPRIPKLPEVSKPMPGGFRPA